MYISLQTNKPRRHKAHKDYTKNHQAIYIFFVNPLCSSWLGGEKRFFRRFLIGWQPGGTTGNVDRHRKANANKDILVGGVYQPGDNADDLTGTIEQRATRIARVHSGVNLNQAF